MAEDAYRAEVLHKWRIRRVNEAIRAVRQIRRILEQDIASVQEAQSKYRRGE